MNAVELVVGNKYWSIKPAFDAVCNKPQRPWHGTLSFAHRPGGDCYLLSIHDEGIVVEPHDLFAEKYQAADAYVRDTIYWIAEQHKKLAREAELLTGYMSGEPYFIVDREHLKR